MNPSINPSSCHLFLPVCQVQVFFDLPALVTVFHGFFRLVVQFAKRMFGIANRFADDFERFSHGLVTVYFGLKPTLPRGRSLFRPDWFRGQSPLKRFYDTTKYFSRHSKFSLAVFVLTIGSHTLSDVASGGWMGKLRQSL